MAKTASKKAGRPSAAKKNTPAAVASHPSYFDMIKEAILDLHERSGSSPYAIAKYMEKKHKGHLPGNFRKLLAVQLRNLTGKGKLVKVKASFKLSSSEKHAAKKTENVVEPKTANAKTAKKTGGVKKVKKLAPAKSK